MKRFIRKLAFNGYRNYDIELITEKTKNLVSDPYNQVSVVLSSALIPFIENLDYVVGDLRCSHARFVELTRSTETLRVKNLVVKLQVGVSENFYESFGKVSDCEALSLRLLLRLSLRILPYFHKLKSLSLIRFAMNAQIEKSICDYATTLHHLSLNNCDIIDVSMLGSIPHLELRQCNNIVDISALNHNDTVVVEDCANIQDYSHSFANSQRIKVWVRGIKKYHFDLTKWTKVEDLDLVTRTILEIIHLHGSNLLPTTVKKCHLSSNFLSIINFTITKEHALKELELSNDDKITSLEGYELHQVVTVKCADLRSLETLQGLGKGKNQKISIRDCHKITDFTPLSHTPFVSIKDCDGFTNPLQLRFVQDLTIIPSREISLKDDDTTENPYEHVQSLNLSGFSYVNNLTGVEQIPYLQLDWGAHALIRQFVEAGRQFQNQKIVLSGVCMNDEGLQDQLLELHNQHLKDHYDYYDHFPKRWTWLRKQDV